MNKWIKGVLILLVDLFIMFWVYDVFTGGQFMTPMLGNPYLDGFLLLGAILGWGFITLNWLEDS